MWSLAWLLQAIKLIPNLTPIFVGYDNCSVADVTTGVASSALAPGLVKLATSMWHAATSHYNVQPFHVHSHEGHPWNEMADSICSDIGASLSTLWSPAALIVLSGWATSTLDDPACLFIALLDDIQIQMYPQLSEDRKLMRIGPMWGTTQYRLPSREIMPGIDCFFSDSNRDHGD